MLLNLAKPVDPKDYGLHHEEWRPSQLETITWVLSQNGFCILEGSVGSGKTSFAAATASRSDVIALCRTKNLQMENYGKTYGFDVLFGKGNYKCIHPEHRKEMADTCVFQDKKGGMNSCPYSEDCPYLVAKRKAIASNKTSLNYPYWLTTTWPKEQSRPFLFMDEAHQLSDITLEWAGLSVNIRSARDWNLPQFPEISSSQVSMFIHSEKPIDKIKGWISASILILMSKLNEYKTNKSNLSDQYRKEMARCEKFVRKFSATLDALEMNPNDWYIKSGAGVDRENGVPVPGLICKPLTAKYHFKRYFNFAETIVLMSATIGEPSAFCDELGIASYAYRKVPNQWSAEQRPIVDLGAPRLGRSSTQKDYFEQARIIADAIKACPPEWSGVIHVTRKSESKLLAERLTKLGLSGRIWIPGERDGTEKQMQEWTDIKANNKTGLGKIAIAWTWWEGVDLVNERICIVAKTPFPYLGDSYEAERMRYSSKTYSWRTATQLEQGLGRTRRGEPEDYDHNGVRNQLVAIADGNWSRVKNYLSEDFLQSIIKL